MTGVQETLAILADFCFDVFCKKVVVLEQSGDEIARCLLLFPEIQEADVLNHRRMAVFQRIHGATAI